MNKGHLCKLTVVVHEVRVGSVPNLLRHRAAVVKIHTHALLLRALTGEDVCRHRLLNLRLGEKDLLFRLRLTCLDLDDLATSDHTDMLKLHLDGVVR